MERLSTVQARTLTASLFGASAFPVIIEADVGRGLARFTMVGLPDSAVREAADRVRSAITRSGVEWPAGRIVINLAPADLRKGGAGLDLGIALALLAAAGRLPPRRLRYAAFHGELSLTGLVREAGGALAVARAVAGEGARLFLTSPGCAQEAALEPRLKVHAVATLREAVDLLSRPMASRGEAVRCETHAALARPVPVGPDLADLCGQAGGRRAVEVAAAGGHNLLLFGPPGSGKTMLARRLPGLLPPPDLEEALEITQVASCAGLGDAAGLITRRPFRAPHHSLTGPALVGGGQVPRPGEVSLAHGGVLFLDEIPEFPRTVLDRLRQPLEEGAISISRGGRTASYPSHFLLVAAMNPCPCGYRGDPLRRCLCTPQALARYRTHLSGPLLDRIDLHVEMPRVEPAALSDAAAGEGSEAVRLRVLVARRLQTERFQATPFRVNGDLDGPGVKRFCQATDAAHRLLIAALTRLGLSARAHDRILKVARTLADLAGDSKAGEEQVAEAIAYRALDRPVDLQGG